MFSIPGKNAVTLTPAAVKQIASLMEASEGKMLGLRLGLKKGGCAGMEYTMEYAEEIDPNDEVVEQDGARHVRRREGLASRSAFHPLLLEARRRLRRVTQSPGGC